MKQLTELSETELKAIAFDQIQLIEHAKANLAAINQELSIRRNKKEDEK